VSAIRMGVIPLLRGNGEGFSKELKFELNKVFKDVHSRGLARLEGQWAG